MWKCIHRGLRTSANLLKTDQSNGGAIVSSVIGKDFDELPTQSNTSSSSAYVDDATLRAASKHIVDKDHDSADILETEVRIKDVNVYASNTSFRGNEFQSRSAANNPEILVYDCDDTFVAGLVCCRRCHQIYGSAVECLCCSKDHNPSWLSRKLHIHYPIVCSASTYAPQRGFLDHSTLRRSNYLDFSENKSHLNNSGVSRKSDSLIKIHDPSSAVSFLQPYHRQKKKPALEEKHSLKERSQICHNFTSCLLKLPFLSYDFMRSRGLNQLYECLQNKEKTEDGDSKKGQKRGKNYESGEARKESWRRHQVQQSLLEAIGLSSALLLGWFLVQCRVWHPCGERHNGDHQRRGHGSRCGMFSRLIFPRVKNPHQPLNAVPSNSPESNGKFVSKEQHPSKDDNRNSDDSCIETTPDDISELFSLDGLQEENMSKNFVSSLTNEEITSDYKGDQGQINVHSTPVEENEKEPIPMPWHTQQSEQYGPITLEQAMDEAGKSLEEVHAEVLLQLALDKLEVGEESDDESSAVDLLTEAAHLGSSVAAFNLGICYEMGVGGVTKDLPKAYYWYKVASNRGHPAAMYNMAIYHAQGLAGFTVDTKLARQLLERASSYELPEARDALTLLTSLKPTATAGFPQNDSVMAHHHGMSKSSLLSMIDEESEASFSSDRDQLSITKTSQSHDKECKNLRSHFSHMMSESLLSSFTNEDCVSSEKALDDTLSVKQTDSKYMSALAIAH